MRPVRRFLALLPLPLASWGLVADAQEDARTLRWPRVHVEARLDADGVLHVRETQDMRLTGDWNGGERRFDVRAAQAFTLFGLSRVDSASGQEVPLVEGGLDAVDHYASDGWTVRWRSRLSEDPPFADAARTYRLAFAYRNILVPEGDGFRLDHDFAFRDREAPIEAFTLALALDSAWQAPPGFTGTFGPEALEPGVGFVVNVPLRYAGPGRPAGVVFGADARVRGAIAGALLVAWLAMLGLFVRRERALGRFGATRPVAAIDAAWLDDVVFRHRPEVVGAAWDDSTGAAEVTALLARLEAEGVLRSRMVGRKLNKRTTTQVLQLELLRDRDRLRDYERAVVNGLFFGDRRVTDTDAIRAHYRTDGFDPAERIKAPLAHIVAQLSRGDDESRPSSRRVTVALLAAAVGLMVTAAVARLDDLELLIEWVFLTLPWNLLVVLPQAFFWRGRVHRAALHLLRVVLPLGYLIGRAAHEIVAGAPLAGPLTLAAIAMVVLAWSRFAVVTARWPYGPRRMALRRDLTVARRYFIAQLRRPEPALQDAWFPYLIAFGLARSMDKWFRAFGGTAAATRDDAPSGGVASQASPVGSPRTGAGPSWTGFGGGGGFAGGGSSGSWAAEVSRVAAGVPAPSSSSGSSSSSFGSSSSGSSSSGGGGGGGW